MNDLLELKERRAKLQDELNAVQSEILAIECERSYLGKLHKVLPNSAWAKDHDLIPARCPRDYFGGSAPTSSAGSVGGCRGICRDCWNSEVEEHG